MDLLPASELATVLHAVPICSCKNTNKFLNAMLLGAHQIPLHKGPQHPSYATDSRCHRSVHWS